MSTTIEVIKVFELIKDVHSLRSILIEFGNTYTHNWVESWLLFTIAGHPYTTHSFYQSLYRVLGLQIDDEVGFDLSIDSIQYPSIVRDRRRPIYLIFFLSPNNVMIYDSYNNIYRRTTVNEAIEYATNIKLNGGEGYYGESDPDRPSRDINTNSIVMCNLPDRIEVESILTMIDDIYPQLIEHIRSLDYDYIVKQIEVRLFFFLGYLDKPIRQPIWDKRNQLFKIDHPLPSDYTNILNGQYNITRDDENELKDNLIRMATEQYDKMRATLGAIITTNQVDVKEDIIEVETKSIESKNERDTEIIKSDESKNERDTEIIKSIESKNTEPKNKKNRRRRRPKKKQ